MSYYGSRTMQVLRLGCLAAILLAAAGSAFAHHSAAMFDRDKKVELVGTIVNFSWSNPHSWIEIDVPNANRRHGSMGRGVQQPEHHGSFRLEINHFEARRPGDDHHSSAEKRRKGRPIHVREAGRRASAERHDWLSDEVAASGEDQSSHGAFGIAAPA